MTKESLFNRLSNELLEASNQIQSRFEEGLSALLGEESSSGGTGGSKNGYFPGEFDDLDLDGMDEDEVKRVLEQEMMDNSPLEGIADSVIADIVSRQVSSTDSLPHPLLCCSFNLNIYVVER